MGAPGVSGAMSLILHFGFLPLSLSFFFVPMSYPFLAHHSELLSFSIFAALISAPSLHASSHVVLHSSCACWPRISRRLEHPEQAISGAIPEASRQTRTQATEINTLREDPGLSLTVACLCRKQYRLRRAKSPARPRCESEQK